MAAFEKFQKEAQQLESQGHKAHPIVKAIQTAYTQQADEADKLLREKQEIERKARNTKQ